MAMQGFEKMLKMMGIDAESLKLQAKDFYDRIVGLETRLEHVTHERLTVLETEVSSLGGAVDVALSQRITILETDLAALRAHFGMTVETDAEARIFKPKSFLAALRAHFGMTVETDAEVIGADIQPLLTDVSAAEKSAE